MGPELRDKCPIREETQRGKKEKAMRRWKQRMELCNHKPKKAWSHQWKRKDYLEPPVKEVRNTWSHQWKRHRSSLGAFEGNMVQLISWKKKFLLLSLWLFGMDTLGN